MTNLPDRPSEETDISERRLSNRAFELVIRRAAELQARDAERWGGEGISEAEVMRIGRELGLSPEHLHQALAETSGALDEEHGFLARLFGPRTVHVGRVMQGKPEEISHRLERYLLEREYLAVLRRFPDRVIFTRAVGVVAAMGRATSQVFSRSPLLKVTNLEMVVNAVDEEFTHITLGTSLANQRTAAAAGSILGGGTGTAVTGAVLGIAIAPPAALIALPILGLSVYGGHAMYESVMRKTRVQLESLLDRLQHGELPTPGRGWARPPR